MKPAGGWPGPRLHWRVRHAGFSLLELAMVVIVVSVVATIALGRFLYYQERAEKIAMESTLAIVKMGLQLRLAELIVTNRQADAVQLERENPMKWVDPIPDNYAGEYASPIKQGNWYYAAAEHELVYVPSGTSYLDLGQSGLRELRYHAVIQFDRNAFSGQAVPIGVGLAASREFKWF